jgi:hypothetical protein
VKSIISCIYVLFTPFIACLIALSATSILLGHFYSNPVQERVTRAVEQHFLAHRNTPVDIFHDNVFVATKDIEKGQKLDVNALEREVCVSQDDDPLKVIRYKHQYIVGSLAANNISKGQLIFAKDFNMVDDTVVQNNRDKAVKEGTNHLVIPCSFDVLCYAGLAIMAFIFLSIKFGLPCWLLKDTFSGASAA